MAITDEKLRPLLVDQKEQATAILGSGYLEEFVINKKLNSAYGIVTDKRLYIQGKCYQLSGKKLRSTKVNTVVDLEDITSSGLIVYSNITSKILKIVHMVAIFLLAFMIGLAKDDLVYTTIFWVVGGLAVMWIGILWKTSLRIIDIRYAGGEIAFPSNLYSEKEVNLFQAKLRECKERIKNAQKQFTRMPAAETVSNGSSMEDICKAAELFKAGLLSEEEYSKIKSKALAGRE